MLAYIYHKTLWKYKTTTKEYNKFMINNIINKNKNSYIYSSYQLNISNSNNFKTYIYKLYNLYQSIKLIIKITESESKNKIIFHPFLFNKLFRKYFLQKLENQNKITVKRKSKAKKDNDINDIKLENSLSSIRKTIDLDDKDNIQNGCLDFATGNEMIMLLKNFQKRNNDCLYNNYYNNCNIYKKKKSPQVSFCVFSPKKKFIFGEKEYSENINKKNLINNNIFINNNNYNNHTNYIINDYKDIKEIDNLNKKNFNYNETDLKIEKKYHYFSNFKSKTNTNLLSNRLTYRNRVYLPLSQSCEKFIYTKKYISSKIKQDKLGNKASEEKKNENEEKELYQDKNNNNLNNIKIKYIPCINKNSNIKIIENKDKEDDVKIIKIEKLNYIGRNNKNKANNKNKFPFLLSRITKNSKNNRKSNLTQEQFSTKFNSTFNMNYITNFKLKQKQNDKSKMEKSQSNCLWLNNNAYSFNNNNLVNDNNNALQNIINKKDKKSIKRKENNLKFKKSNTAKTNFKNINKNLRQNLFKMEKAIKKESEQSKKNEDKKFKKFANKNTNQFHPQNINKENIFNITAAEKNKVKKASQKELINPKISCEFQNIVNSTKNANINTNLEFNFNKTNSTKNRKTPLFNSKSNSSINTVSRQLFSPSKIEVFKINKNKNNNHFNYDNLNLNNNFNYNTYDNSNCFNTLPNNSINADTNTNTIINDINQKTISPLKKEKNNLILNRFSSINNKKNNAPIKVNLNNRGFNEFSYNKDYLYKHKSFINNSEEFDSKKELFSVINRLAKEKNNLKGNSIKPNKNIKIKFNN